MLRVFAPQVRSTAWASCSPASCRRTAGSSRRAGAAAVQPGRHRAPTSRTASLARGHGDDGAALPAERGLALSVGTTLGVVGAEPAAARARAAGRGAAAAHLALPRRASPGAPRSLAGAGLLALVAQQVAVMVTVLLARQPRRRRHAERLTYVQAVYLLPYAVLAVPVATSAFPALVAETRR